MAQHVTHFYDSDDIIHSLDSTDAVTVSIGDSIRFHTTEPSDRYVVGKIRREITILDGELKSIESHIYLTHE